MLGLIRKFQRSVFILIAGVIIATFSLFGVQYSQKAPKGLKDNTVIGRGVDGSSMMKKEIDQLVRFISTDSSDIQLLQKGKVPNFFNSGVVRKDLLSSGLGKVLITAYFDVLKDEVHERIQRHNSYLPYQHPSAPFIGVQALYGHLIPKQKVQLDRFLHREYGDEIEALSLLIDLYLGQSTLPEHLIRRYLQMQQNAYSWVPKDPHLDRTGLSLFQCDSLSDWFGNGFIELCAQFIHNAALISTQKGYRVTTQEAKVDLMRNGYDALKKEKPGETITKQEVGSLFMELLTTLDMDEKAAVDSWKKVMLFKRLFDDIGDSIFLDPHLYKTFHGFASKSAELDVYHLPSALEIKDFSSLFQFHLYLNAVSDVGQELELPQEFKKADHIKIHYPELVENRFLVEIAEIKLSDLALNVPLKAMWSWQANEENFLKLEKKFPQLSLKKQEEDNDFLLILDGLDANLRSKIDLYSREEIAKMRKDWIQDGLNAASPVNRELNFSHSGKNSLLQDENASKYLKSLLEKAAFKDSFEEDRNALEAREALHTFFAQDSIYYRIHLLDRDLETTILTFEQARERGILETLALDALKKEYQQLKITGGSIFRNEDNTFKSFDEVKDRVAEQLLYPLLNNIDAYCEQSKVALTLERKSTLDSFYPFYRFYPYLQAARSDIRAKQDSSTFLTETLITNSENTLPKKAPLSEQWSVKKSAQIFNNYDKNLQFNAEVFSMVEKSWSKLEQKNSWDHFYFYQLNKKLGPSGNFSREIVEGSEVLSKEAKCFYMSEVVTVLKEKEAIYLTSRHAAEDGEGA